MKAWRFSIVWFLLLALASCHSPQHEAKASEPIPKLGEDAETPEVEHANKLIRQYIPKGPCSSEFAIWKP